MKKIILVLAAVVCAAFSLNAQVMPNGAADLQYQKGNLYQNGQKLTPDQALQVLGSEVYDSAYKPAKGLRTAGITMVSVGGAFTALGAGFFIAGMASKSAGDTLLAIPGTYCVIGGAAVAIVGGVLWGVGNKKMKNIVPASNGAGLAFAF